jgi:predicted Zn-dependent protease
MRANIGAAGLVALTFVLMVDETAAQVTNDTSREFKELSRRAEAAQDTHPAEAASLYRKALSIRPDWAEGWLYLGASLFQSGHYADARNAFRQGVSLAPGRGTPLAFLGMAEYELHDYKSALSDILKGESIGLADKPDFVAAVRYRAALAALRLADFAQALEQVRPLVKAGNDSPSIIEVLGLSALFADYLPSNLPPAKRPLVERAGRAAWAFVAERADQSEPLFTQLEQQFPNEPGVHYMCGVFRLDHDPVAAEEEFRKEIQIAARNVPARVQLVLLLIKRGEAAEAVKVAGEAVELQPADALCQATLGRALLSADRTSEAITALEAAAKLAPAVARTHFYLEQAYRRAGRMADARKEKAEWDRLRAKQEPVTVRNP